MKRNDVNRAGRPRTPGYLYSILAIVMLVVVGVVALSATQPPPLTIAEFAPQAVEQITDAPSEQGSAFGEGGVGDCPPGAEVCFDAEGRPIEPTPRPEQAAIDVPRVRSCVGDPPRQIEDPQSPPCVPYWQGDNGGETWKKGVSGNEIRVAIKTDGAELGPEENAFAAFFNRRFELYGRRITLVPFPSRGDNRSVEEMQADADDVDDMDVFAVLGYSEQLGREFHFYDAVARKQVVSVQGAYTGISLATEDHLERFAPYQWNYLPAADVVIRNYAAFICATLAGEPPVYAGGTQRQAPVRKFGVVTQEFVDSESVDVEPMFADLRACGVEPVHRRWRQGDHGIASQIMIEMRDSGVTSVLCLCPAGGLAVNFMTSATNSAYLPEWLISNFGHQDDDFAGGLYPSEHQDHVIGLMSHNKSHPLEDMFWYRAVKEVNPEYNFEQRRRQNIAIINFDYWNMLLLASGIQMAGPDLNPQTFERALMRTRFPNPGCGAPPWYQGCVGFGVRNHTMIQDFAPVWFDRSAPSYMVPGQRGAYCYVDQGRRYGLTRGGWPEADPKFRQGPCR